MNVNQNTPFPKSHIRPEVFEHLISMPDYELLITISIAYFKEKNIPIRAIENGIIKASGTNGEEVQFGLDNLVRKVIKADKEKWDTIIYDHYSKLRQDHKSAYNYLFKDFEYASQFLKVVIKDQNFIRTDFMEKMVHRIDFPETCTMLILDFEEQFRFLMWGEIKEWEVPIDELFEIALQNIRQEEVSVMNGDFKNEQPLFLFIEANFAASFMIDLQTNAPNSVGNLGALVTIPTKGVSIVHPITDLGVIAVASAIAPLVMHYFNESEGSINTYFYWLYNGEYAMFPIHTDDEGRTILHLPPKLEQMLNGLA